MSDISLPISEATPGVTPDEAVVDARVTWVEGDGTSRSGVIVNIDGLSAAAPTVSVVPDDDPSNPIDMPLEALTLEDAAIEEDAPEDEAPEEEAPEEEAPEVEIEIEVEEEEPAEDEGEESSPWAIVVDHPECTGPEGTVAVVAVDAMGVETVESCQADEAAAQAHIDELMAADAIEDDAEVAEPIEEDLLFATKVTTGMSELERAAELAAQVRATMELLDRIALSDSPVAPAEAVEVAVEAAAEVVADEQVFTAIAEHSTDTDDGEWDGSANEAQVTSPSTEDYFSSIYAWRDDEADTTVKAAYKFIHHFVGVDGDAGAASTVACSAGIAVLNGGRGGTTIPEADRHSVYTHLAHHLTDAGKDAPALMSQDDYEAALVISNGEFGFVVPPHTTATSEESDGTHAHETRVTSPSDAAYFESIYAWRDPAGDPERKSAYKFLHHVVDEAGNAGAASTTSCTYLCGVLNGGMGGTTIPEADRLGVYAHLAQHLDDAGKDAPALLSQDAYEAALNTYNADNPLSNVSEDDLMSELARRFAEQTVEALGAASEAALDAAAPTMTTEDVVEAAVGDVPCPDCGGTGEIDGGECVTCKGTGVVAGPEASAPEAPAPEVAAAETNYDWNGVLIVEGLPSGDGRQIAEGALVWRELPIPLMLQTVNAHGHEGAIICGSIHEISRDGQNILGSGNFDSGAAGQEALRLLSEGTMRGVSADIDSVVVEFMTAAGEPVPFEDVMMGGVDAMEVLVEGRIMGATLCPFPAFQEAHVTVSSSATPSEAMVASGAEYQGDVWSVPSPIGAWVSGQEPASLVASAALTSLVASAAAADIVEVPARPPAAWFEVGEMTEPVPFTIFPDGRCYGLVAAFGTCHIGFSDRCVPVPKSASNYKHFRNKSVLTDEGTLVATGPIFMDTVHPNLRLKASDAQAHYADTGCAFADVALYENEFGIVAAGALRPGLTEAQVRTARASDVSPDWRTLGGRLDVVGLLSVNVSGFIVEGLVASGAQSSLARGRFDSVLGEVTALVAAGMVHSADFNQPEPSTSVSNEDLAVLTESVASMRDALEEFVLAPAREARLAAARSSFGFPTPEEKRAARLAAAQSRFQASQTEESEFAAGEELETAALTADGGSEGGSCGGVCGGSETACACE